MTVDIPLRGRDWLEALYADDAEMGHTRLFERDGIRAPRLPISGGSRGERSTR